MHVILRWSRDTKDGCKAWESFRFIVISFWLSALLCWLPFLIWRIMMLWVMCQGRSLNKTKDHEIWCYDALHELQHINYSHNPLPLRKLLRMVIEELVSLSLSFSKLYLNPCMEKDRCNFSPGKRMAKRKQRPSKGQLCLAKFVVDGDQAWVLIFEIMERRRLQIKKTSKWI